MEQRHNRKKYKKDPQRLRLNQDEVFSRALKKVGFFSLDASYLLKTASFLLYIS
ncbi:hypothetical protein JCM9152_797 [Halalkalibacter hemicellulosilyticusJCM 9152]|uniref:Uncharacterized protein n=1 Tax=Halalkalibacter hemicellulosilyticusJCM 9152 TaxID=1236971 RepID=W4QDM3_9BACI|nr:hypothetical protein JCM9152_797 [Halalkalibacter hemicellulosilyticusJCM 9152]